MESEINPKDWLTIPVLPCESILDTLSFWEMLGFKITYKQTRPYQYGVVERNGYALHFGRVKGIDTANNTSGCLVMVSDIDRVYKEFTQKLKENLGRVPHSGIPRISRMKPGTTRFTLTDVSGNYVIFINYGEKDLKTWEKAYEKNQSPLQKAIAAAINFRDYKEDINAAATTLDGALRKVQNETSTDLAEALIIRMDLAVSMNDLAHAIECKEELNKVNLGQEDLSNLIRKHNVEI